MGAVKATEERNHTSGTEASCLCPFCEGTGDDPSSLASLKLERRPSDLWEKRTPFLERPAIVGRRRECVEGKIVASSAGGRMAGTRCDAMRLMNTTVGRREMFDSLFRTRRERVSVVKRLREELLMLRRVATIVREALRV